MSDLKNPFEDAIDNIIDRFCANWTITTKLTMDANDHKPESLEWRILQFQASMEALKIELKIHILNKYKGELEGMFSKLNRNPDSQESGNPGTQEPRNPETQEPRKT